uniref:Receptor expression-enhancing protein 4 n=1 Tax=Crocodylus porosus TaxID=8502 RepID=A0A7M4E4G0_CROPO
MVSWMICRLVVLVFGMLYPAYASYKAVKTKNIREYVRWMMYWIVFALFMATETLTDVFISWFPFYYEIKMAFVVWLLSPYTKGASLLYRKFIHPTLSRREKEIDMYISQAKERGYETMVNLGKRSLNIAATAAVQAATKSQGALAGRLRSFSMQDLRSISDDSPVHYEDPLYLEEQAARRRPPIGLLSGGERPGQEEGGAIGSGQLSSPGEARAVARWESSPDQVCCCVGEGPVSSPPPSGVASSSVAGNGLPLIPCSVNTLDFLVPPPLTPGCSLCPASCLPSTVSLQLLSMEAGISLKTSFLEAPAAAHLLAAGLVAPLGHGAALPASSHAATRAPRCWREEDPLPVPFFSTAAAGWLQCLCPLLPLACAALPAPCFTQVPLFPLLGSPGYCRPASPSSAVATSCLPSHSADTSSGP